MKKNRNSAMKQKNLAYCVSKYISGNRNNTCQKVIFHTPEKCTRNLTKTQTNRAVFYFSLHNALENSKNKFMNKAKRKNNNFFDVN